MGMNKRSKKKMMAGQASLLWRQCANLQPLLEKGKRNGASRNGG